MFISPAKNRPIAVSSYPPHSNCPTPPNGGTKGEQIARYQERLRCLSSSLDTMRNNSDRMKYQLERLGDQLRSLDQTISSLDGQIYSTELEIARLEGQRAAAKHKKNASSDPDERSRLQDQIWRLSDQISNKSEHRYRLREQRSSAVDTHGRTRDAQQSITYKLSELRNDITDCERQRDSTQAALRKLENGWG